MKLSNNFNSTLIRNCEMQQKFTNCSCCMLSTFAQPPIVSRLDGRSRFLPRQTRAGVAIILFQPPSPAQLEGGNICSSLMEPQTLNLSLGSLRFPCEFVVEIELPPSWRLTTITLCGDVQIPIASSYGEEDTTSSLEILPAQCILAPCHSACI